MNQVGVLERTEIRLAGEGGQGMILAGIILAEAAAIYDRKNTVQSQSYGPEARGGASKSEVIISDETIDFPEVINADILICLSQEAYDKYAGTVKEGGLTIVDTSRVAEIASKWGSTSQTHRAKSVPEPRNELWSSYPSGW